MESDCSLPLEPSRGFRELRDKEQKSLPAMLLCITQGIANIRRKGNNNHLRYKYQRKKKNMQS